MSTDADLRHFKPATKMISELQTDFESGKWIVAEPASIGRFSAVGFHFARQLRDRLQRPVGLINLTLGGSGITSWISESALLPEPVLCESAYKDLARIRDYPKARALWEAALPAWELAHVRSDQPSASISSWGTLEKDAHPVQMPTSWKNAGLPY